MKKIALTSLALLLAVVFNPLAAQDADFEYITLKEGLDAAKENDKVVMVYLYSAENGGLDAYENIWAHPLVSHYSEEFGVLVAIDSDTEEGDDFIRHLKKRLKVDADSPGIYFFSNTGRSLGNIQGPLTGSEAPGRVLMALGAADYARHDNPRRYHRYSRWY